MSRHAALVACVAENSADWYRQVENLAISLRNFGGRLAGADFVAHFVGGVDPDQSTLLRELGVELRAVDPYPASEPTTNKLRMFEEFAWNSDAELLIALDCDTVVVGDFLDEASPEAVAAVPARTSPLDPGGWGVFLENLGLPVYTTPTTMIATGEAIPAPYVNSGVLLVPRCHAEALAASWTMYVDRFTNDSRSGVHEPWTGYFIDQVALACALLDRRIPLEVLGLHVNLSVAHNDVGRQERAQVLREGSVGRVKVLHHHRHLSDDGRLLRADEESPLNDVIDRLNRVVVSRAGRSKRSLPARLQAAGKLRVARALSRFTA